MDRIFGKVFVAGEGEEFGVFREASGTLPAEIQGQHVLVEDGCGNYVLELDGAIYFWDHELGTQRWLAKSLDEFIQGCRDPEEVELEPGQVNSVWVDPEFAKEFGLDKKP